MSTARTLLSKLAALFKKRSLETDMAEEMRQHMELRMETNIAGGMSPTEARYDAMRQFGHADSLKEAARDERGWRWFENFAQDTRYGLRTMIKRPGFTVAVVLTLALGIGFVTTLFTMINGVVFGQLPFSEPERIVNIEVSAAQYDTYARQQQSCETFAFFQQITANLRTENFASRDSAVIVSDNFFEVLRVQPFLGRGFLKSDAEAGADRCVIIAYGIWEREFQKNPEAIGRTIHVNGEVHTVIGVMAPGFGFPFNQQVWIPRRAGERIAGGMVFGRLRDGVSERRASEEFTAITASLATASAVEKSQPTVVKVESFAGSMVKDALRIMLLAILGATFLVLILACANVTNLILARAVDRRKELAVRAALGAGRGRLICQMLTENLVLVILGAAGGLLLAIASTRAIWNYMMREGQLTGGVPVWINFDVDGQVFGFVAAIALVSSLITGLIPALQISRVDLNDAMKEGTSGGLRITRLTRILVNAQMAFSVCLVTVAGLFLAILMAYARKPLPYDPTTVLTAQVALEGRTYNDAAARLRFFDQLVARLAGTPGVVAAGLNSAQSLRTAPEPRIELEGERYTRQQDRPTSVLEVVSPDFLPVYNSALRAGRAFTSADGTTTMPVAMVNAGFAERFGRERDVLGRRYRVASNDGKENPWITIVGVVPDLGSMKAGKDTRGPVIYRPYAQASERTMTILIRGNGDATRFANVIRREVAALDPDLPVSRLQTVAEIVELERIGMNAFGSLFVVCGLGALALASVGAYGVVAFSVRMRVREFGVRLALGASPRTILRLVMKQGVHQISIGLGVGVLLALAASAALNSAFEGFSTSLAAGWIYVGVVVLLGCVGAVALFIPALRGSRVDPMTALRAE